MPQIKIEMISNNNSTSFEATRTTETQAAIDGMAFLLTTYGSQVGQRLNEVRKLLEFIRGVTK